MGSYEKIKKDILNQANKAKAEHLMGFFKTGKGQYGEGDVFLGLTVPQQRQIAKAYFKTVSLQELQLLLNDEFHEIRLTALIMMTMIYEKADETKKKEIFDLYIKNVQNINNWDLVDLSAPRIVGEYVFRTKAYSILRKLADTDHLWSKRIAVVSNYYFIKQGEFSLILEFSEKFLDETHDLMHKATGWMLREMGKMDMKPLYAFLDKFSARMPRTMLRYSIEKLPEEKRLYYLNKESFKKKKVKI